MRSCRGLVYVANARLPTEKAHGYQICKMCEAFACLGVQVKLLHPYRENPLNGKTVFDYYGVRPIFEVCTLPNWDVIRLNRWFPDRWFTPLFFLHSLLWGRYAGQKAALEKAEVYYTREAATAFWLVRMGLPTVYEAHVVPNRAQRWLLKAMAHHPALRLTVVLTSFIRERFTRLGFPTEKVIVLPDGVDLDLFEGLPSKEDCRRRLGLPLDRPIIGYIGRFRTLEMEKGIRELVEAIGRLASANGAEPLLLCVGGPTDAVPAYLELARRIAVSQDRLRFVDRVPNTEVPYWIRSCDIATIPWTWTEFSAYFTSPLKLFEYMAAGVPILATDLPSIREVLCHAENAWLVPPGAPKALAEGMRYLLEHPVLAERLARQAREDVRQHTWKRRAAIILQHESGSQKIRAQ